MANLIRMDIYRIFKTKAFWVCMIIAAVAALGMTPFERLMWLLARALSSEVPAFEKSVELSSLIGDPFPLLNAMLAMLSACAFFYADQENGYIKNIAGQMPRKGYTLLSKFVAAVPHNLLFMLVGVVAKLLGTLPFKSIAFDGAVLNSIGKFCIDFLLLQSICAILLLVTAGFANKSLGTVLAVLFGTGLLVLVYMGIDSGLDKVFTKKSFSIAEYMPDQLLGDGDASALRRIVVALVTCAIFLPLGIRVVDRKEIK
ncbi:MAG: hypothetical protein IJU28_01820 [Clostridia bacterium]|nr:hypothetical protein [Clostridia bacterium]